MVGSVFKTGVAPLALAAALLAAAAWAAPAAEAKSIGRSGGGATIAAGAGQRASVGIAREGTRETRKRRARIGAGATVRERRRRRKRRPFIGGFFYPFGIDRFRRRNVTVVNVNTQPPPAPVEVTPMSLAVPTRLRPAALSFDTRAAVTIDATDATLEAVAARLAEKRARLDRALVLGGVAHCPLAAPALEIARADDGATYTGSSAFTIGVADGQALLRVVAALEPDTVAGLSLEGEASSAAATAEEDRVATADGSATDGPVRHLVPTAPVAGCR